MKKLSMAVVVAVLVGGCSSIPLEPCATRVIVTPQPAPKGCRYVGQVVGNQGNFLSGSWTSNRNLEEGAMNDLRNQASKLGANYVQLLTNRAGNTGSIDVNHGGGLQQTNVTNLGNAYVCPASLIGMD